MTDARTIIAEGIKHGKPYRYHETANSILDALREARYRILSPGQFDPPTVEICADMAEVLLQYADTTSESDAVISKAIRSIGMDSD